MRDGARGGLTGEGGRRTPEDLSASERSVGSKGSASPSKSLSSSSSTSAENLVAAAAAAGASMEMKVRSSRIFLKSGVLSKDAATQD